MSFAQIQTLYVNGTNIDVVAYIRVCDWKEPDNYNDSDIPVYCISLVAWIEGYPIPHDRDILITCTTSLDDAKISLLDLNWLEVDKSLANLLDLVKTGRSN